MSWNLRMAYTELNATEKIVFWHLCVVLRVGNNKIHFMTDMYVWMAVRVIVIISFDE